MNNYAKLIDGRMEYAPNSIRTAEGLVCNPRPDKLIPLGYKEVIFDEQPGTIRSAEILSGSLHRGR